MIKVAVIGGSYSLPGTAIGPVVTFGTLLLRSSLKVTLAVS